MRDKSILIFVIFMSLNLTAVNAGVITLSGVYQGKNLYVQNPFTSNMRDFCTNEVFVNNVKVMSNVKSSAYEIDLSHLKLNDLVTIKITHKDDCKPKILNPQVLRIKSKFQFTSFKVDESSIDWITKGEEPDGKFYLEKFSNNNWISAVQVKGKGSSMSNNYSVGSKHHSGMNKYRVKVIIPGGQVFYSKVVEYSSDLQPVTFYPKRVTKNINLSRDADYEILDVYGNVVKKGSGSVINCSGIKTGVYYLNIDNRTEKFFKK